jgi:CheY-like chemotaxis protein
MRSALRELLQLAGYEVQVASDGREALALQRAHPAQVLLTDLFMPEQDGLETIQAFRAQYPGVRVIAMSGGHSRLRGDYLSVAEVIGADTVLRKPFPAQALLDALDKPKG